MMGRSQVRVVGGSLPTKSAKRRKAQLGLATLSDGDAQRSTQRRRTRKPSPPTTKPDSPDQRDTQSVKRRTAGRPSRCGTRILFPLVSPARLRNPLRACSLVQDSDQPSPRGEHARDATIDSPAVTPPVPPDKAHNAGRTAAAPGLSMLQIEGEPKRSMRVRGNTVELEGGMPPLDIHKRLKVTGKLRGKARGRAAAGAQTPEVEEDGERGGQVLLPGVSHSRRPKQRSDFKLPFRRLKSVEKDWSAVDWEDIEYELDAEDEEWLGENAQWLNIDADNLERLLDRLEKCKANCVDDDIEVPWEAVGALVTSEVPTVVVAAVVGWWQEKRRRHPAPLLRRLRPQTDFHDQDPDGCFRPQVPAPMSVRERTSAVDYRVIATGANQPLTQPAAANPPAAHPQKRGQGQPGAAGRVQRLASSKIQIRPGCCVTPPFLELAQPGPKWCDDSASVLDKVREMALARLRQAQRQRAEAAALKERHLPIEPYLQPETGRKQHRYISSDGLDLVVGATVAVKAVEFGESHAKAEFGKKWRTASYTGVVVTVVSDAQFDGTDPRFEDGADVCMVKFDDGVFPVKPSMCTVLISPEQRRPGQLGDERQREIRSAMPNIQTDSGRISTGASPGKRKGDAKSGGQAAKRHKTGESAAAANHHGHAASGDSLSIHARIFYAGDTVRCPKCKELMRAPQAAYALRCATCLFAITPASLRDPILFTPAYVRLESAPAESSGAGEKDEGDTEQREPQDDSDSDDSGGSHSQRRARPLPKMSMLQQLQRQRAAEAANEARQGREEKSSTRCVKVRKPHFKRWRIFDSVSLAAEAMGADRSDVTKCAKGKIAQLQGWICEYVRDDEPNAVPEALQMDMKQATTPVSPIPCIGDDWQEEADQSDSEESAEESAAESGSDSESEHDESDSESEITCMVCGSTNDDEKLMLCDGCDNAQHTFCCVPKLNTVPKGDFHCSDCAAKSAVAAKRSTVVLGRKKGARKWRRFESTTAAALSCGVSDPRNVSKCCRGKMGSCRGFEFKWGPAVGAH